MSTLIEADNLGRDDVTQGQFKTYIEDFRQYIEDSLGTDSTTVASNIEYDNTTSGLSSNNIKSAIDELAESSSSEFIDTNFKIIDDSLNGASIQFSTSSITSGSNIIATVPNYSIILGGVKDKEIDDTNIANDRILVYKTSSGKLEYEDKPEETTWTTNDERAKTALNASGTAPIYAIRAWVNFNGIGVVAIRNNGNVASITDNGTGDYTINMATALPTADYAVSGCNEDDSPSSFGLKSTGLGNAPSLKTTTQCRIVTGQSSGAGDANNINVMFVC